MGATALEKIADREHAVTAAADQVRAQIAQLTAHLHEFDAELADLAVARKVILALGDDESPGRLHPGLPDNPVYQHILTVLADADAPLRAKDLCRALDTGIEPSHIEGMRCKLKRLVRTDLATETAPGLFTLPQPQTSS
jgi:hypothetical protein